MYITCLSRVSFRLSVCPPSLQFPSAGVSASNVWQCDKVNKNKLDRIWFSVPIFFASFSSPFAHFTPANAMQFRHPSFSSLALREIYSLKFLLMWIKLSSSDFLLLFHRLYCVIANFLLWTWEAKRTLLRCKNGNGNCRWFHIITICGKNNV